MDLRLQLSEKSKDELIDLIIERNKKIEELDRELKKYKNPNTPSSSNKHIKSDTSGLRAKEGAKRGAPVGHKGATLTLPEAEEIIPLSVKVCSCCGSANVKPTGYVKDKDVLCLLKPRTIVKRYKHKRFAVWIVINLHWLTTQTFQKKVFMTKPFKALSIISNSEVECLTASLSIQ